MKRDLRKQNLKLNFHFAKGQKASLLSDNSVLQDIDDDNYLISLNLTKNIESDFQSYDSLQKDLNSIEYIEIEDDYAIKNFKDYYILRYGNNKRAYLKNVLVNLVMGQTKTIKCDVEVEPVLRLLKVE
ncbi:hypothetical protein [Aequorivita echinoideorum]|uniref:Uncharacterized protein n=1 Tax=Aequorivita echinoideorum TaxID=1549647 RepID=A0ABS5S0B3_9FLAO|nr:hypothetical protein [Aequorivita echinoideorum]MBT0606641.1 hypothetical protein [Aequorivita echinoideorum]